VLDCSDNVLTAFPEIVLPNLHTLDAYKNQLTKLPETLGQCTKLKLVNFFNNKIIKMPPCFADLEDLEDINFASNKLKTLPKVNKWKKLKRLAVFWNNLVMLPSFEGLEALEILQMHTNPLGSFPAMGNHPALTEVDFNSNNIEELDEAAFGPDKMPMLESFQLAKNKLKSFPSNVFQGSKLNFVNVSDCAGLAIMPENIGDCTSLTTVFWANTAITSVPDSFEKLTALERVNVSGNTLDEKSVEMCMRMKAIVDATNDSGKEVFKM